VGGACHVACQQTQRTGIVHRIAVDGPDAGEDHPVRSRRQVPDRDGMAAGEEVRERGEHGGHAPPSGASLWTARLVSLMIYMSNHNVDIYRFRLVMGFCMKGILCLNESSR
jgi:hypothetical protein